MSHPSTLRAEVPAPAEELPRGKAALWSLLPEKARSVLSLYTRGIPIEQIARDLAIPEDDVLRALDDPISQRYLELRLEEAEREFQHLLPAAIDALRSGLSHMEPEVRLRAADQYWKLTGRYKSDAGKSNVSAEDIVQQLLIQVNVNTSEPSR